MDSGRSARDSDGGDVRKTSTSSSGEEGQSAKVEGGRNSGTGGVSGVGPRSPSVGDSEREVTSDPAVFDVVLRGGSPWGFYLCGGTEVGLPLQVSEVEVGGKAEVAKLCEGDIVLQVNGIPCSSRLEGLQLVESAFRTLTLHVYRGSADAGCGESGGPRSPAFLQRLQEIQKREREKGQEFRREREKEGQRREIEKGRVQDDSAVFRQSRSSQLQALRMKPRQRRGESFNVGKSPSGASAAPQQPISSRPFGVGSQHPHPLQQQQHPASQHHPPPQQQQQASWRERYQRPSEYGRGPGPASRPQLTPAKSSPSLNLPPEDPHPRSPTSPSPGGVISPAKSSPNLAEGGERERQFVQVHGKRPAMYEQPLSGRTVFPYPGAKAPVAWGADSGSPGSPDKASLGSGHGSGLSNRSYDAGSQLSVSSSKSGASFDGASHKSTASYDAGSHVSGSSSRSGSSYGRRYSENFGMGGSGGASAGVGVGGGGGGSVPGGYDKQGAKYDDSYLMDSRRSKHERRSLPPHMLHKYQADYANVGSMGAGSLHSEKISEIDDTDDEFDADAPQVPPRPSPEAMGGPPSSPPAPPVRDPSSLIQSKINQAHEKYPSWPVTKPNGASEQSQAINTRAQSWTDHTNTNKDFPSKKGPPYAPGLRTLAERNSPSSERKSDDGKSRNSSDPGLKTEFVYDHYGRVRQKPVEAGKPRFEEFYNSKPGYPPPKLDSDGHNFGDKEYSVPSPPERDVPPVDQRTLTDKLTSPDTPPASGFPGPAGGDSGSKTEPVPSDSVKPGVVVSIPGSSSQAGSRPRTLDSGRERMYADSSTSPLEPKPSVFPITVSHDGPSKQTQMVLTQSKAYIVKQTPYYNTGTQTDMSPSYEAKTSVSADKKCNAEVQVSDFAAQTSPKSPVVSVQQPQPDPSSGERREAQRPTNLSSKFPPRSERSSGDYLNFPMKGPDGPQSQSSPKKEKPSADPFGFHSRGRDNQGPQSHSSPRYDRGSGGDYFSFPPRASLGSQGEGGQPRTGSSSSAKGGGDYLNMPPRKDSGNSEPQWSRESLMAKYATDEVPGVEPSQPQAGDDPSSIIRALSKEYFAGHLRTDRRQASTSQETESLHSSSQGGMREAESCNSVVIHPMENLGPFAQGGAGGGGSSADFGSRSSLTDSRLDVSSVVSEASSKGSARGRYSLDPAQMARSRALADVRHAASSSMPYPGPLSSGGTPIDGPSERPKTLITSNSMGSLRPQLLSPTDSRSSGSVNFTRDSSPSGSTAASSSRSDFHSRTGSDSVFVDERRGSDSGSQGASGRHMAMPSIGRTASMKKAYGTYDETERAFVRAGATSATSPTEEARSPTLPVENNTMTSGNYVQMNQIPRATRYSEPKPLDQIQEEGDVFSPEDRAGSRGSDRRSSDRTPTSPDREGLPGSRDATGGPFPKGAEARPTERHPSTESRGGACGGAAASPPEQPQPAPAVEEMPRRSSERSASISSQDDIYHRPPLAAQEEHSGRRYSDWNAVRQSWRGADSSRQNTSLKRSSSEQIMPISAAPHSLAQPPNSARMASDREARAAEAANRANASEEDLKRFQQMAVLNFMEMKTGQRMSSASVGSQDTIPSSPADSTATSNPYEQIGEHLAGGPAGDGSSVSDLISRTNEALAHRAQRAESFRRSGSSSSPSRHGSFNEYMEMSRSGALAVRKETEWSRLRTGLYPEQGASPGIGSIPGPSQRSSLCSDHHYEDINLLHLSSQRSSLQEPLPDDGSHPAYRQLFGRELQAGLEQAGGSGGMESGMMAAHTYQNLGQRRPPPPPPPRSPSPERAPPALPPRMYRQQPSPVPPTSPTLPPPHPGHPSTQPALPQRRPEARPQSPTPKPPASGTESQVDETKIDFKTLVNQWESNSPREDNYVDELRRKARQHLPNATTAMSMSILHSKPNINLSQSFKREPVVSQEATPPNSLSPEGSEKSASLEEKDKAPQRPPPPNMGPPDKFSSRVDMDATSLKTVSPTPPARSPPPPSGLEPGKMPLHQRPPPPNSHLEGLPPRRGERGGGAEGVASHDQDGGKPRSQSFDLLSQGSRNPPGPQESSPRMGPRGSLPTPSGSQGGESKRRDRAWSEHGEGGRKFRHGSSSSNQSDERQSGPLSRSRTGSDAPLPSPPPLYGDEARGEEQDLPPPPVELLAGNPEFPDNSYGAAAFKNRANRQVGTYQRSSSEAILRPAPTYKIPSSSSTEFESARMGRSTWNSDSALVSQSGAPLPPRDSQTTAPPALPDRSQGPPLHDRHGAGSQDRSSGRLGPQLGSVQDGGSSGERLGGSGGFVAHGRSSSQMSSSSSSSGELPRAVPAFKTDTQAVRAVKSVAQPLQRPGQRSGYQGAVSNPVPVPARNGAVSDKQEVSGSVRSRIQTFEPGARVSGTAPPPSSSSDSSRVFSRHVGSAPSSGGLGDASSRSKDGGSSDRHRPPQDPQTGAGSGGVGGVPQVRVSVHPVPLPERTRAPAPSGERLGPKEGSRHDQLEGGRLEREVPKPPPDDLSLPLRSPSGSEASSGGLRREMRDTQSLPSTPGSSVEDSGRLSSGHSREPSQEELECDKQARELARELETKDSKLSAVLKQDAGRMQFMDGLFSTPDQDERRPASQAAGRRGPGDSGSSPGPDRQDDRDNKTVMPPSYFKSSPKALVEIEVRRNESSYREEIRDNDSLVKQKEELMDKLKKKLVVLEETREQLTQEIQENEKLGNQIWEMVQRKCKTETEKQKYKSYVADQEKIVNLLLNLAGQLARAENAVQSLAPDCDQKLRKMTLDKREKLSTKHEDAKLLKQDIDKRSEQVAMLLRTHLTEEEFSDYSYFVKMKSKLTIEFQELKDKITLGQEQMEELRRSIPSHHS